MSKFCLNNNNNCNGNCPILPNILSIAKFKISDENSPCKDQNWTSASDDFSTEQANKTKAKSSKTYIWLADEGEDWEGLARSKDACNGKRYSKLVSTHYTDTS